MSHLRDAMRKEAGRVWREKAEAESLGLFMNEETITETVLFQLAKQFQSQGLWVRPFTKAQETKSGADWEFWFVQDSQAIGLRVQAKRLFPNGAYDSLHPGGPQTQNLIQRSGFCHPVFVFYNDSRAYLASGPYCWCGGYYGPTYRGCTLASAYTIRRQGSRDANKLAELTIPWHCLLCGWASHIGRSLLETIASSLNHLVIGEDAMEALKDRRYETVELPDQLRPYVENGPGSDRAGIFEEPFWLAGYLQSHALAGVALIVAGNEIVAEREVE